MARVAVLAVGGDVRLDVLLLSFDGILVGLLQQANAQLNVTNQGIATSAGKVLSHNDTQHLESVGVGCHSVSGDNPSSGTKVRSESKLVIVAVLFVREAESNQRQTLTSLLGHDEETLLLEDAAEVVGGAGEVAHDGAVAVLAETDELVVLADDLGGALGEVEGE